MQFSFLPRMYINSTADILNWMTIYVVVDNLMRYLFAGFVIVNVFIFLMGKLSTKLS